jgi:[CysO sulfur-carrier protein]-S-L-cysteine hydrolase
LDRLLISPDCWALIFQHVVSLLPEEACGLLAGKNCEIEWVIPVENHLHSPFWFKMDAKAQIAAFKLMQEAQLEWIGIYHSHPNGPPFPSERDIHEHAYPEILSFICYPDRKNDWKLQAFQIFDGKVTTQKIFWTK